MVFDYVCPGPKPWNVVKTNEITVTRIGGIVRFTRRYRSSKDGSLSDGIEDERPVTAGSVEIAKAIHWGCAGWQANGEQVFRLAARVQSVIDGSEET